MDGSSNHTNENEAVYISHFQKDKFVKGGEPVHTKLLDVTVPQGVSQNAGEFKEFLVDLFKLLDPFCWHDDLMKKFIPIGIDGASSNVGCKIVYILNLKRIIHITLCSGVFVKI